MSGKKAVDFDLMRLLAPTVSGWKYLWNVLAVFLLGSIFASLYAAASWYKPVTTILTIVLIVGFFFVYRGKTTKDQGP